jgi:predicted MFS family arabinose efflux permease
MSNNVIAAILGVIAAAIAALILSPVVYIVFNAFFELYIFTEPPKGAWINDAIIITTVLLWIFAASMAGGYICSKYSERKEDFSILLFIIFSFIILLLVYGLHFLDEWMMAIPIATFIIGACVGNLLWLRKKKRIEKTKSATEIE